MEWMTTVGEPHFTSSFHYTKQSSNTYHFSTLRLSQSSHAGFLKKLPYKVVVDIVHFGCYCWLCYCGTRSVGHSLVHSLIAYPL